jgi:hypothetical protein
LPFLYTQGQFLLANRAGSSKNWKGEMRKIICNSLYPDRLKKNINGKDGNKMKTGKGVQKQWVYEDGRIHKMIWHLGDYLRCLRVTDDDIVRITVTVIEKEEME